MKRNFPGRRIGSSERREIGASGLSTSWADCLSQVCARVSHVCTKLLEELPSRAQCIREAQDAATVLAREGIEVPEWSRFTAADCRAPQPVDPEVGEWTHGWQFHASIARNTLFGTSVHLPPLSTDHQALRASQRHFSSLLTSQETTFTAEEFRTLLLVRLHLLLHMDASLCKCGEPLDVLGHHMCTDRSVDASRDLGRGVHGADLPRSRGPREGEPAASRSEHRGIIANSLAFWEASKSPLTPPWSQRWRVGARRGVASKGRPSTRRNRTSAASTPNCSPGPSAINDVTFLQNLARYNSLPVPRVLRRSTQLLFFQRWTVLLVCTIQRGYAASLLGTPVGTCPCVNGPAVHVGDLDRLL